MCGIAGVLNLDGRAVSGPVLRSMTDAIAHRGPDGEGFFIDGTVGLGHRRLAIIDLSPAGQQPMVTAAADYVLTYNGEIYNFQDLRRELEDLKYEFKSRTDSEVVLNAYAEWGPKCVHRFNGMFAFAVWDKRRRELFLCRDRYGIKPLYYTKTNSSFLFASEIKALLVHPDCSCRLDKEGLLEYFSFQNFLASRTLFNGISLLLPGTSLTVPVNSNGAYTPRRYWDFTFAEPSVAADEREYAEELDRLLRQAVHRQLTSDVPVGSYLSGGVDSGSLTAIAAREVPYLRTFTCGFDMRSASGLELGFDERAKAEYMSYLFKTEHYEMVLKAGDMERVLPKLTRHLEEPRIGQSYPNFYVAQLASKFVGVVLGGSGGDELFGGYPWRYYRAVVNDSFDAYIDKYYLYWQRLIPNRVIERVFTPIWSDVSHVWTRDIFKSVFSTHADSLTRPEDYVNHSLYFEARTFLHSLLIVEDKLSMAHGLEARVPFLDNDLVDFAMQVPISLKLANLSKVVRLNENAPGPKTSVYFNQTQDGKLLLRRVLSRYVPNEVSEGAKQGFSAPDAGWFKGESIEYVKKCLLNRRARIFEFMDYAAVADLVHQHLHGEENRRLLIWSLLSFENWCEQFL
jgi:asparagine synthase (glutamine-hydrolysing)